MGSSDQIKKLPSEEVSDEAIKDIMNDHDLDEETAEQVKEIMEELGVDEDEAVEIEESL